MTPPWDYLSRYEWIVVSCTLVVIGCIGLCVVLIRDHEQLYREHNALAARVDELEQPAEPEPVMGPVTQPAGVAVEQWAHQLTEPIPTHGRHAHPAGARAKRSGND